MHVCQIFEHLDYTTEQLVLLSLPTAARRAAVQLRWYQPWYSGYGEDTWSLDDVLIGAIDTLNVNQPVTGYVDDFNSGVYKLANTSCIYWKVIS